MKQFENKIKLHLRQKQNKAKPYYLLCRSVYPHILMLHSLIESSQWHESDLIATYRKGNMISKAEELAQDYKVNTVTHI